MGQGRCFYARLRHAGSRHRRLELSNHRFVQGRLSLALPILAMGLVGANNAAGQLPQVTYGTWFVLIFVWVGNATITDALAGLGNRRLGEMLLETLEPGDAVAILDLDHFKKVNDDTAIRRVTDCSASSVLI
jgi:GGDEF domain-containing protein